MQTKNEIKSGKTTYQFLDNVPLKPCKWIRRHKPWSQKRSFKEEGKKGKKYVRSVIKREKIECSNKNFTEEE